MHHLTQRQESLILLLERPDLPCLPERRHRWRWRRAVNPDRLKQTLLLAWWARREIETKPDLSPRVVRFQARLDADRKRAQA